MFALLYTMSYTTYVKEIFNRALNNVINIIPYPPHLTKAIEMTNLQVLLVDKATHSVLKSRSKHRQKI